MDSPVHMPDDLNREEIRLRTFTNWPYSLVDPQKLACTGFYFIKPSKVRCYFCNVQFNRWEEDDDEVTEHIRWSQNCPLMRRRDTNNVPIDDDKLDRLLPPATYDVCGPCGVVIPYTQSSFTVPPIIETPTYPEYAIESVRFRSFKDWPKAIKQKRKDLSDAGFFYTQTGDRVKCFSCGGGLRDWDEDDDPWEQHALWFAECKYLKLIKGQIYIDSILAKYLQYESESDTSNDEENQPKVTHNELEKINSNSVESASSSGSDERSNSKLCKVCYNFDYNTVFVPCGHVVACGKCASSVTKCVLCRKPFERIIKLYFS